MPAGPELRSLSSRVCCPQMADPVPDGDDHRTLQQHLDQSISHAQRQAVRARRLVYKGLDVSPVRLSQGCE